MTVLAAHQPQYLPWLGFFAKLARADVFVLLDDVQFTKNGWQNRNRIKGPSGPQWITVPVRHQFPQTIDEVEVIEAEPWRRKHVRALQSNYGKAAHFAAEMPLLAAVLERSWSHLAPLNIELTRRLTRRLEIDTRIVLGSELETRDHPTLRLVDLCRSLDADVYLSGAGGRAYLDARQLADADIELRFQDYAHPTYPQLHGDFEPCMSVVDLLMNCGPESSATLLSGDDFPPAKLATP
jgi:hypothetical protein